MSIHPTEVFFALSDPARLRIIRLLTQPEINEACSCDLADALDEPEYGVSKQLKILRACGLLMAEKEGRWIYHRVRKDHPDLGKLIQVVAHLPDESGEFQADLKRLKKVLLGRGDSRCKGRSLSQFPRRKDSDQAKPIRGRQS